MQEEPYVILGGGASGLAAANALLDKGIPPLVIEGGAYPAYRICGEFISYEALPILQRWGILPSLRFDQGKFCYRGKTKDVPLKQGCGSLPRIELEKALLNRVLRLGGRVLENSPIKETAYIEGQGIKISLESGQSYLAKKTFWSMGRNPFLKKQPPAYLGLRAQVFGKGPDTLEMELLSSGYLGKAPVGNGVWNIAALSRIGASEVPKAFEKLIEGRTLWDGGVLKSFVPAFGFKKLPNWPNCFFIGEGIASIPPITGKGVTLALVSADLAVSNLESRENYEKAFRKGFSRKILFAKTLSYLFTRPLLAPPAWTILSRVL